MGSRCTRLVSVTYVTFSLTKSRTAERKLNERAMTGLSDKGLEAKRRHPDRFFFTLEIQPNDGMDCLRKMEQAKAVIDQLDVDKDGKVSYPEFILVMKYKK